MSTIYNTYTVSLVAKAWTYSKEIRMSTNPWLLQFFNQFILINRSI